MEQRLRSRVVKECESAGDSESNFMEIYQPCRSLEEEEHSGVSDGGALQWTSSFEGNSGS